MRRTAFFLPILAVLVPNSTFAHEVYVLDKATIAADIATSSVNPLIMVAREPQQFTLWAIIGVILVTTVFAMSISHYLERLLNPFLMKLKRYAAPIARVTLGACLIASAYHDALFGPELPFSDFWTIGPLVKIALYVSGALLLVGLWTRAAAILTLLIFALSLGRWGVYMTNYANYLGEALFALILGAGSFSLDRQFGLRASQWVHRLARKFEPYAFPILRILFGVAVAFASYFAKFQHSQLALDVVAHYNLTQFFQFEPLFVVLGAFCVELLIGLFLIIGLEIRHTALFFLFWIFLSLLYFGEAVWPHLVLIGVLFALFCHGYDKYSLQGYYFKREKREPVL